MLAVSSGILAAALIINLIVGIVVGLVPLLLGRQYGLRTLGIVGFVACVVLGVLLGFVVAIIVAILFGVAIWATGRSRHRTAAHV
jgi:hypothetical protein